MEGAIGLAPRQRDIIRTPGRDLSNSHLTGQADLLPPNFDASIFDQPPPSYEEAIKGCTSSIEPKPMDLASFNRNSPYQVTDYATIIDAANATRTTRS